ncbi:putative tail component [Pseudomonas phage phiK7A1]|uniref:Putative tail component n=1 Tax=Pseudomonas phage phiK7A1 TaxID=2759194 RepID=A0A7H0XFT5_9CAUD|nr:putative tail component [Pseudomonas phage phiK7A1]
MAELNQFEIRDYVTEARGLVTEQFKGKPIMDKYLRLMFSGVLDAQDVLKQIQQQRSIDTAIGAQLDVIGEIVGRPRGLVTSELFSYFGFEGNPLSDSFGSLNDPTVGSAWYSLGAPYGISRLPSDEEYRLILKAKIIKNRTLARPEDVIEAYKFLFGASRVTISEAAAEPASVRVGIGKILTNVERGLLFDLGGGGTLLPKPVGVSYSYTEFDADRVFALDGFPGAIGLGDLSDPSLGGILSNLIT